MKPDLTVNFCSKKLSNPLFLTSGILGTEAELLSRVASLGAGVVTTKSCCLEPRAGHENPTILAWECGIQNAVGLTSPGVKKEAEEIKNVNPK
jgi:dihydroorotate dehydrogenase